MNRFRPVSALWLGCLWLGLAMPSRADLVAFTFGKPTNVAKGVVAADVFLHFDGSPGDTIEAIQLGVLGSSVSPSHFLFDLDKTTLPTWMELAPIRTTGVGLYAPSDPINGPFLLPSSSQYHIGNLIMFGLPLRTNVTVTLADGPAGLGTDVAGTVGGVDVLSFAATGQVAFAQPNGITFFVPVPEPSSITLFAVGGATLLGVGWKRRRRVV